ncbi:MAG: DUF7694 domain-containing protein [Dermatophilaceae bacterium]
MATLILGTAAIQQSLGRQWRLARNGEDGQAWVNAQRGLSLIWSVAVELDGRPWLHLSMSGRTRLPTWAELVEGKEAIAGPDVDAYQIIPRRANYVNLNEYVLHLFVCLEGQPLPDFSHGSGRL